MKLPTTLFFVLCFGCILKSQTPDFLWQKTMNTDFPYDFGKSILETSDNGYLIFGTKSQPDYMGDFWLFKLDSNRNLVWEHFYGGSQHEEAGNMIQTADGNYILAGSSNSQDGDVTGNHGEADIWLVKVDVSGNILWEKSFGGSHSENYGKIVEVPDNGFLLIASSDSVNGNVGGNNGSYDYWVVKISDTGEIEWENNFGGSDYEVPISAISTAENEYIVVGYSDSDDGDISQPKGDFDYWAIKISATGELVWEKSLGGSGRDRPMGIINGHGENEFLVFGNSNSSNGDVSNALGLNDGWVVNIDLDGNIIWDKSFGGEGADGMIDFKLSMNDGFIYSGIYQPNGQLSQCTVEETDADGNEIWKMLFGTAGWWGTDFFLQEIKYSEDGNLLAVGSNVHDTFVTLWLGKIGLNDLGNNEVLLKNSTQIYPNPTADYFTIQSENPMESVIIYNLKGQNVFQSDLKQKLETKINVKHFPKGNYTVVIKTSNQWMNHQLLIN